MPHSIQPKSKLDRVSYSIGFTESYFLQTRELSKPASKTYLDNCKKVNYIPNPNILDHIIHHYPYLIY